MSAAFIAAAVVGSSYRRRQSIEAPAMMGKNIQHTKSCIRSRSSGANACGSKKEEKKEDEDEEEETFGYCFSSCYFDVKEWFWKRQQNKAKKCFEDLPIMYPKKYVEVNNLEIFLLPDDILEMCLNRLPLASLKNARLVCKKWSSLIIERRLLRIRKEAKYQNLWLFVLGRFGIQSLVTILWELDLMELTWTEISTDSDYNIDWRSANFVANRNLIFGIDMFEAPRFEILNYFGVCDVSDSNMAKWSYISTNFVAHRFDNNHIWTRCMVVIHVNI